MAIPASEAGRDLPALIERVTREGAEVVVTSAAGSAVLISKAEYDRI